MGLPGARSVENWTEMVASPGASSPVGDVLSTRNGAGGAAVVAEAGALWLRGMKTIPAAANARVRAPTTRTQRSVFLPSFWRECFPEAMATEMLPVVLAAQARTESQIAVVIPSRRS